MKKLLAFHGSQEVKEKYVARMELSRRLDKLHQGDTGDGVEENGCFISCTLQKYQHDKFPSELGIQEELGRIMENIFEAMKAPDAAEFALAVYPAIQPGADLSKVGTQLNIHSLNEVIKLIPASDEKGIAAARGMLALHERELDGEQVPVAEWKAAVELYLAYLAYLAYLVVRADRAVRAYLAYLAYLAKSDSIKLLELLAAAPMG